MVFSLNDKQLASGLDDKIVWVWDTSTEMMLKILKGYLSSIRAMAFSLNSKQLASGSYDNTMRVWDMSIEATL